MTRPFDKSELEVIDAMIHTRDEGKAAIKLGIGRHWVKSILANPEVASELAKRQGIEGSEVAKIVARKRVVTIDALDKNLMQVVKISASTLKETPSLAASKVKAIELGYQRVGMLMDGNFIPDESSVNAGKTNGDDAPRIFRASERTILTHTIETRQEITQRAVESLPASVSIQRPEDSQTESAFNY